MLEEARALLDTNFDAALAKIGEAVVIDRRRPDAFVMLAAALEARGELERAEEAWTRAALKARAAAGDPSFTEDESLAFRLESLVGRARVQQLRGALEQAAGSYREALALEPSDPLSVRGALAEIALLLGDLRGAIEWSEGNPEPTPIAHFVMAAALLEAGKPREAIQPARLALLGNPWLLAALLDEEPPEFGFETEEDGCGPDDAAEFAQRMEAWFELRPERLQDLSKIATAAPVLAEVQAMLEAKEALEEIEDPAETERLLSRLEQLRDPARLRIEEDEVFRALFEED